MALAYYNEFDPDAADWLENLIAAGLIAPGHVDRRSIKEVRADDLAGYTQHHFFAGIGGWSSAARLAGWPDNRPLWTASCPCQPFSVAGKGAGEDDPRHLWPDLFRLWRAFRPVVGVGEQVAGKAGYDWFNGVRADLEREAYASRAVDIPACAIDAPHQRNRLYWCAVDNAMRIGNREPFKQIPAGRSQLERADGQSSLGDGIGAGLEGYAGHGHAAPGRRFADRPASAPDDCGDAADRAGIRHKWREGNAARCVIDGQKAGRIEGHNSAARSHEIYRNGTFWSGSDWIICHDGKARRVADASAPLLVDGVRGRVAVSRPATLDPVQWPDTRDVSRTAAWKGFGNAIVRQEGAEVLAALMASIDAGEGMA